MLTGHSQTVDWRGNTEKLVIRTNDISPLDAVLLLNDDNVERLFGENRLTVDDLHAGDFCLRWVQRKQRKKGDDVWEGLYTVTAQLGDRTFELESEFVVDIDDLRVFRYSDLCRCCKDRVRLQQSIE